MKRAERQVSRSLVLGRELAQQDTLSRDEWDALAKINTPRDGYELKTPEPKTLGAVLWGVD